MTYQNTACSFIPEISGDVRKLATLLMFAQVLDLFFTTLGITIWGVSSEGNHFMRSLMMNLGPVAALVLAKSAVILLILFLATQADRLRLIKKFFGFALGVYFFTALLPWSNIIGNYLAYQISIG